MAQPKTFFHTTVDDKLPLPPPPYQVDVDHYLSAGVTFDPAQVRSILPQGLEPNETHCGIVSMYTAPSGWAIAPFSCFYVGIEVRGYDAPDGSPAHYLVGHYDDGRALEALTPWGPFIGPATTNIDLQHGQFTGTAQDEDGILGRLAAERSVGSDTPPTSGTHFYLVQDWEDRLAKNVVAYTSRMEEVSVNQCKIGLRRSGKRIDLDVLDVLWGIYLPGASFVIGEPRPVTDESISDEGEMAKIALGELLTRIGHAAALVATDGRVLYMTQSAQKVLQDAQFDGRLRAWRRNDQRALDALINPSDRNMTISDQVALERPTHATPLLARAMPVAPVLTGERAVLVIFSDPADRQPRDVQPLLRMLGLTPAEARVAAAIAAGNTVRHCAQMLDITENTARSTMKVIYDKLDVSKQSELASIVARLN
ncbi:hypothetical protein GQE99_00070 [Maritimibacter sp. DP07]|uniref:HTH luxR-type domain-containing protein n=1 Tax=Maritimibacter harenae TaxID=2606218 RepID=A0A845M112_9RHOB|nr:LuxR C-terminal-related transcriptional regulator [Maritimibacter harenae]MZR11427.1 hypothetical protein [Maritimibacter harenae]